MATQPILLHAHERAPNPVKVAILLEALGVPYTVKLWEFQGGNGVNTNIKAPEYLKICENGRVPAIEDPDTGVTAWETSAIFAYLLRKYDTSHKLHPADDAPEQQKVDFDKWIAFLISTLGPMSGQAVFFRLFNPEKNEGGIDRYVAWTNRCYKLLEGQLAKSDGASVLEQGYSAVDMHFYAWVRFAESAGIDIEEYPTVKKWSGLMGEKAEVKGALGKIEAAKQSGA